jgi:FixJ family two-component response regulator
MPRIAYALDADAKTSAIKSSLPTVFIIEPDPISARFIFEVTQAHGLTAVHFTTGEKFYEVLTEDTSGCAILEVDLPGISGIQLQERIAAAGLALPMIMIAADADAAVAVRAMKLGATDFLQKPCHPLELWEAIQAGLERNQLHRRAASVRNQIQSRLATLSSQELLVLDMILAGKPNKTIAHQLELSVRSVDFRRASILRKMQARTLVELAQLLTLVNHRSIQLSCQMAAMV